VRLREFKLRKIILSVRMHFRHNITAKTVTHPITGDIFIVVRIGQKQVRALLDTGSYASLISDKLAKALKLQFMPSQMSTELLQFFSRMPVIAVVEFQVNISDLFMPVTAKVVENPVHDLILGASFMTYNQVSIDFRTRMVSMADDFVHAPLQSDNRVQICVTCKRSVCISPYSEALISATCDRRFDNQTVLLEPLTQFQFRRFALARSLNRC